MIKEIVKKKAATFLIQKYVTRLAQTLDKEDFYSTFDEVLGNLEEHSTGQNKNAVEVVRKAAKNGHPYVELARLLVQKRLSETPRKKLVDTFFVPWIFTNKIKIQESLEKDGFEAPWFFVISPLKYCDLSCPGCYANADRGKVYLDYNLLNRIASDAKKIGVRFITISGGEPFIYKDEKHKKNIIDFFHANPDTYFQVYTNATSLIDKDLAESELSERIKKKDPKAISCLERVKKAAKRNKRLFGKENIVPLLARLGNVTPAISQEGFEEETDARRGEGMYLLIENARKNLTSYGILHGFSITYTRENADILTQEKLIDDIINQDASFGWFFLYIPKGREPNVNLVPTTEQRIRLRDFAWEMRNKKSLFIGDFWNDGPWVGGCIAGARKYFHIRADGKITPCVFADFSIGHIEKDFYQEGKSLKDVIQHPAFRFIRAKQLEIENKCTPCCIIDNPLILREAVEKFNLKPALPGEEEVIQGNVAKFLDTYSEEIKKATQSFWEDLKKGKLDTENVKLSKVIENYEKRNRERVYFESKVNSKTP
ncbi:radical SAM protein [Candidatus Aerophobetes bacterium]|nr:radical SAM protein [Candidatus Aerophobetes bacterium]